MSQTVRSVLVLVVGGLAVALAAGRIVDSPAFRIPKDFPEYWAAGRLNVRGENPYDPTLLLAEQRLADRTRDDAVMMWNPPHSLAVYMPLGLLPPRWAALLWVSLQFAAIMLACLLLWREYAPGRAAWLGPLVGLPFVGMWWVVAYGQNTGLLVLGLAGFLYFRRRNAVAAGAFAALTALKPHLLAGFGVLLLADAFTRRGLVALLTGVGAIAVSLGVAVLANPAAVDQFLAAVRDPGPGAVPLHGWTLPVPSFWLRVRIDPAQFWIQFVPCAVVCVALLAWRIGAGRSWDWNRALPLVVAVSVLAAPYGGWIFDLPVLLVPVLWAAARLANAGRWEGFTAFLVAQSIVTTVSLATPGALHAYWWVAPAALLACVPALFARSVH